MREPRKLILEPDWDRIRQLAAKRLRCTKEEVQKMKDRGDSLGRVELAMTCDLEGILREDRVISLWLTANSLRLPKS